MYAIGFAEQPDELTKVPVYALVIEPEKDPGSMIKVIFELRSNSLITTTKSNIRRFYPKLNLG